MFFQQKSSGPSLPIAYPRFILKRCVDALSVQTSQLVNLSFGTEDFPKLGKIAKILPLFKNGDPLDCFNYRPIPLHSTFKLNNQKNLFTSIFTLFLRKMIFFSTVGLTLGHVILLIIQSYISLKTLKSTLVKIVMYAVYSQILKKLQIVDH